ncbi:MAG: spinster family MFS transporter [Gammaproteobacteria bacterium]
MGARDEAVAVDEPASSAYDGAYNNPAYRWYVLFVLMGVYTFNFLDRRILVILQEPIRREMQLSDTQLGLLTGFTFAMVYTTGGILAGRMADRGGRRSMVALALAIWSGATALSSLAQNYLQLLGARIGVGIGEAGCSPPAHAMISDIFSPRVRATALSIYNLGINFGALIGFWLGGFLAYEFGWRTAFVVVGLPGVLYALLVRLTVAEPPRGFAEHRVAGGEPVPRLRDVARILLRQRTFRHMCAAGTLHAFVSYGVIDFTAPFLARVHDLDSRTIGFWLALSAGVFGAVGTFLGGYLGDRLGARDPRWYLWVPAIATFLSLPFAVAVYMLPDTGLILYLNFIPAVTFAMYLAPTIALTHSLVGLRMRAVSSALLFFFFHVFGMGLGPVFTGMLSDALKPEYGEYSLRYAMTFTFATVALWSGVHYVLAARWVRQDLAAARPGT